ncbi:hypothetical protein LguiB_012773 [Lonicera macranthoides]
MTTEVSDYSIDDFLRDMAPFNLSYRKPRGRNNMWVFWNQEGEGEGEGWPLTNNVLSLSSLCSDGDPDSVTETVTNNNRENVQEYLKYILCNAEHTSWANVALVQFWAPTTTTTSTIGGRWVLKTSNQPFGLYGLERRICEYRKHCTSLEFNILQDEEDNEDDKLAESTEAFTTKDNLLCDCAHKCGIRRSMFLPLFKPSSGCRSGVLEFIYSSKRSFFLDDPFILPNYLFKVCVFLVPPIFLQ